MLKLNTLQKTSIPLLFFNDMKNSFFISFLLHLIIILFFVINFFEKKPIIVSVPIEILNINTKNIDSPNSEFKSTKNHIPENPNLEQQKHKPVQKLENEPSIDNKIIIPPIKSNESLQSQQNIPKNLKTRKNISEDEDFVPTLSNMSNISNQENKMNANIKFEKEFPFNYYIRIIQNKINDNWKKTFISGTNAKVIIYFQILKNGQIQNIKIFKKSDYPEFDASALNAIIHSNPFPYLPENYEEENLGIYFSFEFI